MKSNSSAFRFYKQSALVGLSEYRFEETTLTGAAGEIINIGTGGTNGTRINSPTTTLKVSATANGKICRGVTVPSNATLAQNAGSLTARRWHTLEDRLTPQEN